MDTKIQEKKDILRGLVDKAKNDGVLSKEDKELRDVTFAELQDLQASAQMEAELDKMEERDAQVADTQYRAAKISAPVVEEEPVDSNREMKRFFQTGELRTVTDYQNKGTSADGGYLAPADLYKVIVEKRDALSVVRSLATVLKLDRDLNIPVEGTDATASWAAEGGAISATKQAFAQKELILRKLYAKIGVTEEMLSDSQIDLIPYLGAKVGRLFAAAEEDAFINGTAANNKPVGLLQSGITSTRTATATAVVLADIVNVFEALGAEYRNNASWLISPALEGALIQLNTSNGFPLYQPSIAAGVPATLFGRPVFVSSHLDNSIAASKNIAIFGDLSYYYIGDKDKVSMARFDKRDVDGRYDFLCSERVAGVLTNADAVKILQCKAS